MSAFPSGFAQTLGAQSLPAGMKLQYGPFSLGASNTATTTVTFKEAFINACVMIIASPYGASNDQIGFVPASLTNTSGVLSKGTGDNTARTGIYLAIGY